MMVLVTGGAGFIGSHLVDRLVSEGFSVRVVDNLSSGRIDYIKRHVDSGRAEFVLGDLKDPSVAMRAASNVDVVFHFAANPEVRLSSTSPEVHFNENILATFNVLEAMRKLGVRELVFASSSTVYGEPEDMLVDESAPLRPVSVYGASKAACEALIHAYSKLYGIRSVVLRYANVVGPRLRHGVIYDFINKLLSNPGELEVLGDGKQAKSYIYIDDAVEATLIAWRRSSAYYDVFNVGSGDYVSVDELADIVADVMGIDRPVKRYRPVLHGVGWPGDVKRIALKIDKLGGWVSRLG
ncbi:MAG: NAD-dependent epimerase/dehydratase family protein [Fervidicoccaceae archaeon]|nr:NAD-dependent epimerase/dehydratase family protein [Fervidicoccaceae archaeon]